MPNDRMIQVYNTAAAAKRQTNGVGCEGSFTPDAATRRMVPQGAVRRRSVMAAFDDADTDTDILARMSVSWNAVLKQLV